MAGAGFKGLVDFSSNNGSGAAKPAQFLPNVDVALIEMSGNGSIAGVANVLYDRDSPKISRERRPEDPDDPAGGVLALEAGALGHQTACEAGPAAADVTVPVANPDKRYMAAYPASVLKVMVAHSIYRLVDSKRLTLTTPVRYHEEVVDGVTQTCGYGPSNPTGRSPLLSQRERPTPFPGGWTR